MFPWDEIHILSVRKVIFSFLVAISSTIIGIFCQIPFGTIPVIKSTTNIAEVTTISVLNTTLLIYLLPNCYHVPDLLRDHIRQKSSKNVLDVERL